MPLRMTVRELLGEIRADPDYAGQIVHVHEQPGRKARFADGIPPEDLGGTLRRLGIERLYSHQAEAVRLAGEGRDVLVATGTASGKSLCYLLPILSRLERDPRSKALLLHPTKALSRDQLRAYGLLREAAGGAEILTGVYDGDTPPALRRKLRDHASVVFSNPDMVHAGLLAQHGRWAAFLSHLRILVIDELHVYSGIFGSNMALLLRRLFRVCRHYGADPQVLACSATIGNPREIGERLIGRPLALIDDDGSPRGRRTIVFWNPPRVKERRARRSANVEAHELMARLLVRGFPTIVFSKSKMTAEKIHRYVRERLGQVAPELVGKVTAYRGGYLPGERREIERKLFSGKLIGVSSTPALELGIDVGSLDACIIVGYPGTRASFSQQSGRAGRKEKDSVAFLVGIDSAINQYVMNHPDYIVNDAPEDAVIDPENPFIGIEHLRCAAYELPLSGEEIQRFGPHAETALRVLEDDRKLTKVGERWYHAANEIPNHQVTLRGSADTTISIQTTDGTTIGRATRFDVQPLLHPGAVYMHRGETYLVVNLDLEKRIASVRREEVDYYTQPLGGTDIHHVDHRLREKPFGTGKACWGEVTAYFTTGGYEKIHFYEMNPVSEHTVDLPTMVLETMAVWIVPPEELTETVRAAGLDPYSGLRAVGYATRMLLPLFIRCDTLDLSHTVGSANSPWQAVFIYERHPHGLGFTERAYENLHRILPAVLRAIRGCPCQDGCPCCVGKPLRKYRRYDIQRGEGAIPSKTAALMILNGLLAGNLRHEDDYSLTPKEQARDGRLEAALRRRLERTEEPEASHPITPEKEMRTGYPERNVQKALDAGRSMNPRDRFEKRLRRRLTERSAAGPDSVEREKDRRSGSPEAEESPAGDPLAARAGWEFLDRQAPLDKA